MAKNKTQPNDIAYHYGGVIILHNVLQKARELINEFDTCPEFTLLQELRQQLDDSPALLKKITEFKKMSFLFETKKTRGIETDFEEERAIGRVYAEIIFSEVARRYLETENKLFDILNGIYETVDTSKFADTQKEFMPNEE